MAMSETTPNPSNNWLQFYPLPQPSLLSTTAIDATVVTTTTTTTPHLSLDHGRVSKPIRRRSRASRRTPTTVLNTDTTNFRAMVQQFTGGPVAPFPSHGNLLGFSSNSIRHQQQTVNPTVTNSVACSIQFQQPQNHQPAYIFNSLLGTASSRGEANFPHRVSNSSTLVTPNENSRSSPSNENSKTTENNFMF